MSESVQPIFDVPQLIEASRPVPRINFLWLASGAFLVLAVAGAMGDSESTARETLFESLSLFFTFAVIVTMMLIGVSRTRAMRRSQAAVERTGELVQLHRWQEAARSLRAMLSAPMRTNEQRFEALLLLSGVLSRYHKFEDAVAVLDHLIETPGLVGSPLHSIKLARAMSLLRNEQLFDADRAIADLRRGDARDSSAGLALVEIFRDVKTGHPADAIETFAKRQDLMRDQLGRRIGDAYALIARAHDQLDRPDESQANFTRATLLVSPKDLARRYLEVAPLLGRYVAAPSPIGPSAMEGAA